MSSTQYKSLFAFLNAPAEPPCERRVRLGSNLIGHLDTIQGKLKHGLLSFSSRDHSSDKQNGNVFYTSIEASDVDRAFDILIHVMDRHGGGHFKVVAPEVASDLGRFEFNPVGQLVAPPRHAGKIFAIYDTGRADMIEVLSELEKAFAEARITPGHAVEGSWPVPGKGYTHFLCPELEHSGASPIPGGKQINLSEERRFSLYSMNIADACDGFVKYHSTAVGECYRKQVKPETYDVYSQVAALRSLGIHTQYGESSSSGVKLPYLYVPQSDVTSYQALQKFRTPGLTTFPTPDKYKGRVKDAQGLAKVPGE